MKSAEVRRPMMRCTTCRNWWSGAPHYTSDDGRAGPIDPTAPAPRCGCGGELALVDMDAETRDVPYIPLDPSKDKKGSPPKPSS